MHHAFKLLRLLIRHRISNLSCAQACFIDTLIRFCRWLLEASVRIQVFFETDIDVDLKLFEDIVAQIGDVVNSPLAFQLLKRGLYSGSTRYHNNFAAMRKTWVGALHHKPLLRLHPGL